MDKLYVPIALFPQPVQECIVLIDKIYFFVHFHSTFNVKRKPIVNNFDVLYYESISKPFLMCKIYFETLCRIVFNFEMIKATLYNSLNFYFEQKKTDKKSNNVVCATFETSATNKQKNNDVIFAREHRKFKISVEDFDRKVQKIVTGFNSIYDFWYFCSNLHDSIDWKIKHANFKIFTNFISCLLKPDKEYIDLKRGFVGLCEKSRFEFLFCMVGAKMTLFFRFKQ